MKKPRHRENQSVQVLTASKMSQKWKTRQSGCRDHALAHYSIDLTPARTHPLTFSTGQLKWVVSARCLEAPLQVQGLQCGAGPPSLGRRIPQPWKRAPVDSGNAGAARTCRREEAARPRQDGGGRGRNGDGWRRPVRRAGPAARRRGPGRAALGGGGRFHSGGRRCRAGELPGSRARLRRDPLGRETMGRRALR